MAAQAMSLSDEQLIAEYQSADPADAAGVHANELFSRYSRRVSVWCMKFARGDREVARDLAQEVLMKAYRHLGGFRSDAKFSTWLYSITRNHCLNYVREKGVQPLDSGDPIELDIVDAKSWDALAELERREMAETVSRLISENLDEIEAKVMFMHFGQEVPVATVTELLGLTNSSGAKAFIMSAKRKLSVAVRRLRAQQAGRPHNAGKV